MSQSNEWGSEAGWPSGGKQERRAVAAGICGGEQCGVWGGPTRRRCHRSLYTSTRRLQDQGWPQRPPDARPCTMRSRLEHAWMEGSVPMQPLCDQLGRHRACFVGLHPGCMGIAGAKTLITQSLSASVRDYRNRVCRNTLVQSTVLRNGVRGCFALWVNGGKRHGGSNTRVGRRCELG